VSPTSWSDTDKYKDVCIKVITDENVFKNFKNNSEYNKILEHVNFENGYKYLNRILETGYDTESILLMCKINDSIGNPTKFQYPELLDEVSPSSLRYLKTYLDLKTIYKNLQNLNITEIGGGYGGQFLFIFLHNGKTFNYNIFDLREVSALQNKYIKKFTKFPVKLYSKIEEVHSDLVISNYAFSEINREVQEEYYDKVIKNAKHGYMIFNNDGSHGNMLISELKDRIDNSIIVNNQPDFNTLIW